MAVLGGLLFYPKDRVGLSDLLRQRIDQLSTKLHALPDRLFVDRSDEDIAQQLADEHALKPLVANFDAATAKVEETEVEVRGTFHNRTIQVPGLKATKAIPFTGDPALWRLHPNSWSSNPPRGEVGRDTLVIGMTVSTEDADTAASHIERTMAELPDYLAQQKALIDEHNASLATVALPWIKARRQRLNTAAELLKKLGG